VDEGFFFRDRGTEKCSLYRAIDEHGQVLDMLFHDHAAAATNVSDRALALASLQAVDDHARAFRRKEPGGGSPDAQRRAGDQRHFPF